MTRALAQLKRWTALADTLRRLVLLAIVWAVFIALDPSFASTDSVFSVLQAFAFPGLVAVGVGVTMLAGELDLSVGAMATVGGILAVRFSSHGVFLAIGAATVIGVLYGALQGAAIALLKISSVVLTVGTMFALDGVAYLLTDGSTSNAVLLPVNDLNAANSLINRLWILSPDSLLTLGVMGCVGAFLLWTRWGREIYAIGGARAESVAAGVPQRRPMVLAFGLSGGSAALAGALTSVIAGSGTAAGFSTVLLLSVTAALVGGIGLYGGRGSMLSILLGTLVLESLVAGLTDQGATADVQQLATGGLLFLAIFMEMLFSGRPARSWWPWGARTAAAGPPEAALQ
jgi:ribose transport system permease protein